MVSFISDSQLVWMIEWNDTLIVMVVFFTSKYRLKRLVYFEEFQYVEDAIKREKQLKNWRREWKINLIEKDNPNWDNLWERLDSETSSE